MVKIFFLIGIFLLAFVYRYPFLPNVELSPIIMSSLVPIGIFLVARRLFDRNTATVASLLSIFSFFEIIWTRQAQHHILLQLIILITIWLYSGLVKKYSIIRFAVFLLFLILGWMTHLSFLFIILALFLHFIYLCFHWNFFTKAYLLKFSPYILLFAILASYAVLNYSLLEILSTIIQALKVHTNNFAYYHSFLWKEQTVIAFLAGIGLLLNALKYKKGTFLVAVPIASYLFFLCFLLQQYVSGYLLPIFPLILILAGYAIATVAEALSPKRALPLALIATLFIIINGDTFTLKPGQSSPAEENMEEIA